MGCGRQLFIKLAKHIFVLLVARFRLPTLSPVHAHIYHPVPRTTFAPKVNVDADGSQ